MTRSAIGKYQQMRRQGSVQGASPHRLILILFDNALERMILAKASMERGEVAEKAHHIAVASSILDGLRAAADPMAGGQIADNLQALYGYCIRLLLRAHRHNAPALLEEAHALVREVRAAWAQIPPELHYQGRTARQPDQAATAAAAG